MRLIIIIFTLLLTVSACASSSSGNNDTVNSDTNADKALKNAEEKADDDKKPEEDKPPEEMYNAAQDKLTEHSYKTAAKQFLDVERDHPYSKWATNAQVQAAYAYYKIEQYDDAISTLQRFVKLNPSNAQIPYAYYLIAMSYYNRISDVGRDQEITLKAQIAMKDVIARYPDSEYARDCRLKLDLTEDQLAGKEMTIGRYYLKRHEYVSAINRFKKVVESYSSTAQIEEALYRLVECYMAVGIVPEAQKYAAVLGHNYPGGQWYQDAYGLLGKSNAALEVSAGKEDKHWYQF